LTLFLLSLVAAATPFLPFTLDTSPLDVWTRFLSDPSTPDREIIQIATPFFVALPLAAWRLRRLVRPALRRGERLVMYAIGLAGASLTGVFVARGLADHDFKPIEFAQLLLAPAALGLGVLTVAALLRRRHRDDAATVALTTGYASNGAMLLAALFSPDHPGWWVTLVAVIGIAIEWGYLLVRSTRAPW
jgi:hypothetical protein